MMCADDEGTETSMPTEGRFAAASSDGVSETEADVVEAQLGRRPRGLRAVAHRCPCGLPDVVRTAPRLADGTPFPTLYYLTCPRAVSAVGRLESSGVMREMTEQLASDPELRSAYESAHASYIAERDEQARADGGEPLPVGMQSAGGMPTRVKCLHALVAHELAAPGANPLGRAALDTLASWWSAGPCVPAHISEPAAGGSAGARENSEETP